MKSAVIGNCKEIYVLSLQATCNPGGVWIVMPGETGERTMVYQELSSSDVGETFLLCTAHALFSILHKLVQRGQLYTLKVRELSGWPVAKKSWLARSKHLLVFCKLSILMKELEVTCLQPSTTGVVDAASCKSCLTREVEYSQRILTVCEPIFFGIMLLLIEQRWSIEGAGNGCELSLPDAGIGSVHMTGWTVSMLQTAQTLMAYVKVEALNVEDGSVNDVELRFAARSTYR